MQVELVVEEKEITLPFGNEQYTSEMKEIKNNRITGTPTTNSFLLKSNIEIFSITDPIWLNEEGWNSTLLFQKEICG